MMSADSRVSGMTSDSGLSCTSEVSSNSSRASRTSAMFCISLVLCVAPNGDGVFIRHSAGDLAFMFVYSRNTPARSLAPRRVRERERLGPGLGRRERAVLAQAGGGRHLGRRVNRHWVSRPGHWNPRMGLEDHEKITGRHNYLDESGLFPDAARHSPVCLYIVGESLWW